MTVLVDARDPGDGFPEGFLELPADVYRDDPMWIPVAPAETAAAFDPRRPWFGEGKARLFAVPGRARAAALWHPGRRLEGRPMALFGFWESTGDAAAEAAVLREVEAWAGAQGAEVLLGPVDFVTTRRFRVRVAAEPGAVTYVGEPYNPPGTGPALERLGLRPVLRSIYCEVPDVTPFVARTLPAVERLVAEGFRFLELAPASLAGVPDDRVCALFNDGFARQFGFTPFTPDEFEATVRRSLRARCPLGSCAVRGPDGELVGMLLSYPQYGPLVVQGAGAARVDVDDLDHGRDFPRLGADPGPLLMRTAVVDERYRGKQLMNAMAAWCLERAGGVYSSFVSTVAIEGAPTHLWAVKQGIRHERHYRLYAKPVERT